MPLPSHRQLAEAAVVAEERMIDALESARNPREIPEVPPLMDAFTFEILTKTVAVDDAIARIDRNLNK